MTHCSHLIRRTSRGIGSISRRAQLFTGAFLVLATFAALATPRADAITNAEELTRFGSFGSDAGQMNTPAAMATDLVTGHIYIAENSSNRRISEFTPWGNFVKAFGWDVAPGAVNEQQEVRVRATSGQFKLSFGVETTGDLAFDAPGSESEGPGSVEAALEALPSIGSADVSVSAVAGTPNGQIPFIYVVSFKGSLAGTDVDQLTATNGTTPVTSLEVRTRADGTPGGTGLESCTAESGCKKGLIGAGAGQIGDARSVAMDSAGNLYVKETDNHRVQKFDSAGRFLLMFGGEVNKTTKANICTKADLAGGDECGEGVPGTAPGQFSAEFGGGFALCPSGSFCPSGTLFVADEGRVQRFSLEGEVKSQLPIPGGEHEIVNALAFEPVSGSLYAAFSHRENVRKLNSTTGEELGERKGDGPEGVIATSSPITTDFVGNLFAAGNGVATNSSQVLEFNSEGKQISNCCETELLPPPNGGNRFRINGLGTNAVGDLYVANGSNFSADFVSLFGPAPTMFEAPPKVPPTVSDQFASSVGRNEAIVAAEINPHFWTNTRYYVQYGTGKCSEGGCESVKSAPPGTILTSKVFGSPVRSGAIILEGLQPATTYHYRFVAQSGGGGPVRGIGGEVGVDGEESSFTTYPAPSPFKTDCPNQQFRTGFSAPLTDCRAYEMVSPMDKNNGDIKSIVDIPSYTTALEQSATDGERFTYSSYRAFGDPQSAPYINQYMATRVPGSGWSTEAINPPHLQAYVVHFDNFYKAFSADLCSGWLVTRAEQPLAPGAIAGDSNLYRRDNCAGGGYEALIQVEPGVSSAVFIPILQGTSADGKAAIFAGSRKLTEDAVGGEVFQAYYASEGELRLLCILPSGLPSGGFCSGGTDNSSITLPQQERITSLSHAISSDGSKVYWTDPAGKNAGPGKVYLRLNPGEEQSEVSGGACTEAEKACTVEVSETVSKQAARFLGASADGSKALFEITEGGQKGSIYEFELGSGSTLLATKGLGVAGASEDLSHIYFVSEAVLPETSGAIAGEPNLYLDQEGTKSFIATLSDKDVESRISSNVTSEPIFHVARTTPDGSHLAFISTEGLSSYDNTDQVTGEAASEVYLYEAGTPAPLCVSCNPSGARPTGRVLIGNGNSGGRLAAAGTLTTPENDLYSPRVLSADGQRLFFDSFDALLPRDTNGKKDVYEWESASGAKECEEKGAELYVASSEGCLSLISSGQSPNDSEFRDASSNGGDVFFTTNASLLPQDPGLIDVYDARANGGLPAPPAPPGPCQGEACQFAPPPPNDPTPSSASFRGAGNLKPASRCAKGRVARKGRCVAKKRKQAKKHKRSRDANHNRRMSR